MLNTIKKGVLGMFVALLMAVMLSTQPAYVRADGDPTPTPTPTELPQPDQGANCGLGC